MRNCHPFSNALRTQRRSMSTRLRSGTVDKIFSVPILLVLIQLGISNCEQRKRSEEIKSKTTSPYHNSKYLLANFYHYNSDYLNKTCVVIYHNHM